MASAVASFLQLGGQMLLAAGPDLAPSSELPPGDPVVLIVDDGTPATTNGGGFFPGLILNQFSPEEFPLQLDRVDIMWTPGVVGVEVGDPFFVFLYEDPDGDVFTGPATHRATFSATVQSVDGSTFTVVPFEPVIFDGPGDILVAYSTGTRILGDWAARDLDPPLAQRSYIINWDNKKMPPPVPNPNGGTGQVLDTNWMVRGFGTVVGVPVMLQSVSVE